MRGLGGGKNGGKIERSPAIRTQGSKNLEGTGKGRIWFSEAKEGREWKEYDQWSFRGERRNTDMQNFLGALLAKATGMGEVLLKGSSNSWKKRFGWIRRILTLVGAQLTVEVLEDRKTE